MTDTFNVTASYNQNTYTQGQTIVATISGSDVVTTTSNNQIGPLTIPVIAADGATSIVSLPAIVFQMTTTANSSVLIDKTRPILDTSPTPRNWVVANNQLSISAVA